MSAYEVPPKLCPKCGELIDACSAVADPTPPSAGDVTICLYCAEILCFVGDDMELALFDVSVLPLRERIFAVEAQAIVKHSINQRKEGAENGTRSS